MAGATAWGPIIGHSFRSRVPVGLAREVGQGDSHVNPTKTAPPVPQPLLLQAALPAPPVQPVPLPVQTPS